MTTRKSELKIRTVPTAPKRKPEPEPAWVTDTPKDSEYVLEMFDFGSGEAAQTVEVTRAEFLALKRHLARMRGYSSARARVAS